MGTEVETLRLVNNLEVTKHRELHCEVPEGVLGLVNKQNVENDVKLVHVDDGLSVDRVGESSEGLDLGKRGKRLGRNNSGVDSIKSLGLLVVTISLDKLSKR